MKLANESGEIFVPDGLDVEAALRRTTAMGISAHQDDLEIFAYEPIVRAFGSASEWFTGVVTTNGSGSPRASIYAEYTDEQMRDVRRREQKKAAVVGEYAAAVLLDYPSSAIKDSDAPGPLQDLKTLIQIARPDVIYTHNLADKHDTHVAVTLRVIRALRELPPECRPKALYGCEVWRDLDWMCDEDKSTFEVDMHENLAAALLGVFDSQIAGGKRYDLATMGRRRAHATYQASHATDACTGLTYAMDLTPLITSDVAPVSYVQEYIDRFAKEVAERITKFGGR